MNLIPGLGSWPPGTLELPPKASDLTSSQRHTLINYPNIAVKVNGECFNIPRDVLLSFLTIARMSQAEIQQRLSLDLEIANIDMLAVRLTLSWISEACNGFREELPHFMLSQDPMNMILAAAALGLDFELLRIQASIEALFDFMTTSSILQLTWKAGQANVTYLRDGLLRKLDSIVRLQQLQQMPQTQTHTLAAVWSTLDIFGVLQLSRHAHDANATFLRDALLDRFGHAAYLSAQMVEIRLRLLGLANDLGLGIAEIALEKSIVQSSDIQTLEVILPRAGNTPVDASSGMPRGSRW